jgi:hypothetical protein
VYGPIKFISLTQDPHALFLAGRWDEYAELLRDEATTVVAREGWTKAAVTKAAVGKMFRLDGFLRETSV